MLEREIQLFIADIKPGLLLDKSKTNRLDLGGYHRTPHGLGILLTKDRIVTPKSQSELGILLGYYPKACLWMDHPDSYRDVNYILNYGGIRFNVGNYITESTEWCNGQYLNKLLNKYGECAITLTKHTKTDNGLVKEVLITKIITTSTKHSI